MKSYEKALGELKEIVSELESGDLTLDRALKLFQKGVDRINFCHQKLQDISKKVEVLVENAGGGLEREEFPPDE